MQKGITSQDKKLEPFLGKNDEYGEFTFALKFIENNYFYWSNIKALDCATIILKRQSEGLLPMQMKHFVKFQVSIR